MIFSSTILLLSSTFSTWFQAISVIYVNVLIFARGNSVFVFTTTTDVAARSRVCKNSLLKQLAFLFSFFSILIKRLHFSRTFAYYPNVLISPLLYQEDAILLKIYSKAVEERKRDRNSQLADRQTSTCTSNRDRCRNCRNFGKERLRWTRDQRGLPCARVPTYGTQFEVEWIEAKKEYILHQTWATSTFYNRW